MFFKGSRYAIVGEHELIGPGGQVLRYKKTRFIPETKAAASHRVVHGERLDHISFYYFKDSERFWRICDANTAMMPDELVAETGKIISIPRSE